MQLPALREIGGFVPYIPRVTRSLPVVDESLKVLVLKKPEGQGESLHTRVIPRTTLSAIHHLFKQKPAEAQMSR